MRPKCLPFCRATLKFRRKFQIDAFVNCFCACLTHALVLGFEFLSFWPISTQNALTFCPKIFYSFKKNKEKKNTAKISESPPTDHKRRIHQTFVTIRTIRRRRKVKIKSQIDLIFHLPTHKRKTKPNRIKNLIR